jgi:hypothetical protein
VCTAPKGGIVRIHRRHCPGRRDVRALADTRYNDDQQPEGAHRAPPTLLHLTPLPLDDPDPLGVAQHHKAASDDRTGRVAGGSAGVGLLPWEERGSPVTLRPRLSAALL